MLEEPEVLEGVYKTFMPVFDPRNAVLQIRVPDPEKVFSGPQILDPEAGSQTHSLVSLMAFLGKKFYDSL